MKKLHLEIEEKDPAVVWANKQANKINARGHIGTHIDCYTIVPRQPKYHLTGIILDCEQSMPEKEQITRINSLQNKALILHTKNLEKNGYGNQAYFNSRTFLTENTILAILQKTPLFIIIDSHGIAEQGQRHIHFDKICESKGCHVIENVNLKPINQQTIVELDIEIDINNLSTGKPCKIFLTC